MYEAEKGVLRLLLKAYDGWPTNPDCVNIADTLRSTISALERLEAIEQQTAESQ